jgi:hypothetical protein
MSLKLSCVHEDILDVGSEVSGVGCPEVPAYHDEDGADSAVANANSAVDGSGR